MSTEKNIALKQDMHQLQEIGLVDEEVTIPVDTTILYSDDIDLGFELPNNKDARLDDVWLQIKVPAMTVAHFRDSNTMRMDVFAGTAASPTTEIIGTALVVTGVTAVDPSLVTVRNVKLPADCARYVRVGITVATSESNMTNYKLRVGLVF